MSHADLEDLLEELASLQDEPSPLSGDALRAGHILTHYKETPEE